MANENLLRVRVVTAIPDDARVVDLRVAKGITLREVLARSGLLETDAMSVAVVRAGVFGVEYSLDTPVRDGDRVEIYRTLQINPKEARRQRAASKRR